MSPRRARLGRLIALEGIDGVGKSTTARSIARSLRARGLRVALRREPADPRIGHQAQAASVTDPWTGAVYFTLDRFLARPALERDLARHDAVVTDRSFYSTLAYQGSALGPAARRRLRRLQSAATVRPDLVLWIDVPPADALRRLGRRGGPRSPLERRRVLGRVAAEYRRLARATDWRRLDGTAPPAELLAAAGAAIARRTRTRT